MKKISYYISCIAILSLVLTSCEKTSDDDPSTADRDKFLGAWRGNTDGNGGSVNFNMTITASNSAPDQILMENFDALGNGTFVIANISGNSMDIPMNIIGSDTLQGSGTYENNNTLSFQFTVRDGQTVDPRTGTAHR